MYISIGPIHSWIITYKIRHVTICRVYNNKQGKKPHLLFNKLEIIMIGEI